MSSHATTPDFVPDMPRLGANKQKLRRTAIAMGAPVLVYALVRPLVSSDALGLGIAGALPILYSVLIAFTRRRIDPVALVSGLGFAVACLVSVLSGGSSLPLKVDEAIITFALGLVLVVAVLIRRPLPVGRLLRIPNVTEHTNSTLGAMIGAFLMLHALVHVMLAVFPPDEHLPHHVPHRRLGHARPRHRRPARLRAPAARRPEQVVPESHKARQPPPGHHDPGALRWRGAPGPAHAARRASPATRGRGAALQRAKPRAHPPTTEESRWPAAPADHPSRW